MNIVNLGQAGDRRKGGLTEALDAYSTQRKLSTEQQVADTDTARLPILQQEANARTQEAQNSTKTLATRQSELQLELAKLDNTIDNQHKEMSYNLLKGLSSRIISMDPEKRQMFEASPEYKEITKVIKKYNGDFIGNDGKPILLGKEDIIKDELDRRENQIQQKLTQGGFEGLSQGEKDFITYKKSVGSEAIAKAYATATDDIGFKEAQMNGDYDKMHNIVQAYMTKVFPEQGGLAQGLKGGQDQKKSADPKDPLGLF